MRTRGWVQLIVSLLVVGLTLLALTYARLGDQPFCPTHDLVVLGPAYRLAVSLEPGKRSVGGREAIPIEIWRLDTRRGRWRRIYYSDHDWPGGILYCRAFDALVAFSNSDGPLDPGHYKVRLVDLHGGKDQTVYASASREVCTREVLHNSLPLLLFQREPVDQGGRKLPGVQRELWELDLRSGRARMIRLPKGFQPVGAIYERGTSDVLVWSYSVSAGLHRPVFRSRTQRTIRLEFARALCTLPGAQDWLLASLPTPPQGLGSGSSLWRIHMPDGRRELEADVRGDEIPDWTCDPQGDGLAVLHEEGLRVWRLGKWRQGHEFSMPFSMQWWNWSDGQLAVVYPALSETRIPWNVSTALHPPPRLICIDASTGQHRSYRTPRLLRPAQVMWVPR